MPTLIAKKDVKKLTVEQRLKLIALIWETLEEDRVDIPLAPHVLAEMELRFEEARKDPEGGMSLQEFEKRVKGLK